MKGRKPKHPQEDINSVAARLAAGESASALAKELGWPRTSVLRCADNARAGSDAMESNLQIARDSGAVTRERLFWRAFDSVLRRIVVLGPKLSDKAAPAILESLAKIRPLLPAQRSSRPVPEMQMTEETLMIFRRHMKQPEGETIAAKPVEESSQGVLGEPKGDASESTSDEEPAGEPGPSGEGNGAT